MTVVELHPAQTPPTEDESFGELYLLPGVEELTDEPYVPPVHALSLRERRQLTKNFVDDNDDIWLHDERELYRFTTPDTRVRRRMAHIALFAKERLGLLGEGSDGFRSNRRELAPRMRSRHAQCISRSLRIAGSKIQSTQLDAFRNRYEARNRKIAFTPATSLITASLVEGPDS